jgi:hypothetical protein
METPAGYAGPASVCSASLSDIVTGKIARRKRAHESFGMITARYLSAVHPELVTPRSGPAGLPGLLCFALLFADDRFLD